MEIEDFGQSTATILKHRGKIALPKFAVTGPCYQGYFIDPENNVFGIFEVDSNAH